MTSVKVADGRSCELLTANTHVRIGDRSESVSVILQPGSTEILVGVALLRALDPALLLTRDNVLLLDQDSIDDICPPRPGHLVARDPGADAFREQAA